MEADKTTVTEAFKNLASAMKEEYLTTQAIERSGSKIIIPATPPMTHAQVAKALLDTEKQMEEVMTTTVEIKCHPYDGLICFYEAMRQTFGNILGEKRETWFGTIPPSSYSVPIDFDQTQSVPYGKMKIPGLDIEMDVDFNFNESSPMDGNIEITFKHKRLYEPLVKSIETDVKQRIKKFSVFKGKAVNSQLEFIDTSKIDTTRIVHSEGEAMTLRANIFNIVRNTKDVIKHGVSVRRTILFYGIYGTGKTLTAREAAKLCVENGWTFINVTPGDSIVPMLKFARRQEPAMVFYEDIDQTTSGARDEGLNEILNELDGVLSKDSKVIVILTTNKIDAINPAMMRPGRIDLAYQLGMLDEKSTERLIRVVGGDNIADELDTAKIWEAANGYPPAFVVGAVEKAELYELASDHRNGRVVIGTDSLVGALDELRPQFDLMMGKEPEALPSLDAALSKLLSTTVARMLHEELNRCAFIGG